MLSTTIFATLMAFAAAVPHGGPSVKTGDICGNGNQLYCCNDQSVTNKLTAGLLSDLDVHKLLAGECSPLNVNILLNQVVPIENKCRQQSVCCGEQKQNGLVNLGCTPVTVL
ncbi:hydrophobin [Beauveria brongniartii RCEF 3172]|uniref:Hydrophobin n=1 Tax=Beauveria brongniartii RCEF 3172 TaxID=1081107 RepID=A0A167A2V2_9HYPO|nr:hydrophobin [Beauveria brongniartii RCEF 3172]